MSFELRRWQRDDAVVLAEIYSTADPALLSNIPDDRSLNGARSWIESITDAEAEGRIRAFAIVERSVEGREREKLLYDGVRFDTETAARLAGDPRIAGRRLSLASPDDDDATGCR